jgi:hypothetical protein
MTVKTRQLILRANAIFLIVAGASGMANDLRGAFAASGPLSRVLAGAPHTAIGFVEAHGLALIFGVLLWRAAPARGWHLTAVAIHVLLGTANLVFWGIFTAADLLAMCYITTILHWLFVVLQLRAGAAGAASERSAAVLAAQVQ